MLEHFSIFVSQKSIGKQRQDASKSSNIVKRIQQNRQTLNGEE